MKSIRNTFSVLAVFSLLILSFSTFGQLTVSDSDVTKSAWSRGTMIAVLGADGDMILQFADGGCLSSFTITEQSQFYVDSQAVNELDFFANTGKKVLYRASFSFVERDGLPILVLNSINILLSKTL